MTAIYPLVVGCNIVTTEVARANFRIDVFVDHSVQNNSQTACRIRRKLPWRSSRGTPKYCLEKKTFNRFTAFYASSTSSRFIPRSWTSVDGKWHQRRFTDRTRMLTSIRSEHLCLDLCSVVDGLTASIAQLHRCILLIPSSSCKYVSIDLTVLNVL